GKAAMAESTLDSIREYVPGLPDDNELLVRINGGVQILAGATLLLGIKPRLSALALAGSLIPTTLAGHSFWEMEGGDAKAHQTQFSKNLAALGGLLLIAGDGDNSKAIEKAARKAAKKAEKRALKQA
ncbi:MAG: DoxX family protein, partial [Brevibacterium linens]